MASRRNTGVVSGRPYMGGGHFTTGCWRADRPTGTVAVPEGPTEPRPTLDAELTVSATDTRRRDLRTAANLAAREDALKPRRWSPQS